MCCIYGDYFKNQIAHACRIRVFLKLSKKYSSAAKDLCVNSDITFNTNNEIPMETDAGAGMVDEIDASWNEMENGTPNVHTSMES